MTTPNTTPTRIDVQALVDRERPIIARLAQDADAAVTISSQEDAARAASVLTAIKTGQKQVEARFEPLLKSLHAAHKEACGMKSEVLAPLAIAEAKVKRALGAWSAEQERLRQEAERKRREEEARIERERREAKAAEEARRKAEADAAEEAGAPLEELLGILNRPTEVVAAAETSLPPIPAPAPMLAGISTQTVWKHEVTDLAVLVTAIAQRLGQASFTMVQPNDSAIRDCVRALRQAGWTLEKVNAELPGISIREEIQVSGRARY